MLINQQIATTSQYDYILRPSTRFNQMKSSNEKNFLTLNSFIRVIQILKVFIHTP